MAITRTLAQRALRVFADGSFEYEYTPQLTVVIATIGRPSLERALRSARPMGVPDVMVEIVVVQDTHLDTWAEGLETVPALCQKYNARLFSYDAGFHHYGHPQANFAMEQAVGNYISFCGDDDEYNVGAIQTILQTIKGQSRDRCPILFRAEMKWGVVLWKRPVKEEVLRVGSISAQNIVVPGDKDMLGVWGTERYAGDFDFIESTLAKYNGRFTWNDEVIITCH